MRVSSQKIMGVMEEDDYWHQERNQKLRKNSLKYSENILSKDREKLKVARSRSSNSLLQPSFVSEANSVSGTLSPRRMPIDIARSDRFDDNRSYRSESLLPSLPPLRPSPIKKQRVGQLRVPGKIGLY